MRIYEELMEIWPNEVCDKKLEMVGVRYTICHWAINRTDPQNLLSMTLDVPLQ